MKLLDLYCGAGLAAIGYEQAGWEITGIDISRQPNYPYRFIQKDALKALRDKRFLRKFDAVHASPPCQAYSSSTYRFRRSGTEYADLVEVTRGLLEKTGLPYIIENVPLSPIRPDLRLSGSMFGLTEIIRERWFELGNWFCLQPPPVGKPSEFVTIMGTASYRKAKHLPHGWKPSFAKSSVRKTWLVAMGLPEDAPFKSREISQGIPPAYTKFIGENLMRFLQKRNSPTVPATVQIEK